MLLTNSTSISSLTPDMVMKAVTTPLAPTVFMLAAGGRLGGKERRTKKVRKLGREGRQADRDGGKESVQSRERQRPKSKNDAP